MNAPSQRPSAAALVPADDAWPRGLQVFALLTFVANLAAALYLAS